MQVKIVPMEAAEIQAMYSYPQVALLHMIQLLMGSTVMEAVEADMVKVILAEAAVVEAARILKAIYLKKYA